MARSGRGRIALGAAVAAAGGTYLAEHLTVARWRRGPDPSEDEPRTVSGVEHRVEVADGTELHAVVSEPIAPVDPGVATVVLAHGYTATSHHWAPVVSRLVGRGLRVVTFDQRGHGRSSGGDGSFGADQLATDLAAVLDTPVAGLAPGRPVVLAGHSMGGIGIQATLAARPDLVAGTGGSDDGPDDGSGGPVAAVVLVATLARPVSMPLGKLMSRLGGTALARRTMAHRVHGRVLARGGLGERPALTAIDVVRHGWATCADGTRAGVMRDLRGYDFSDTLAGLDLPVTVMCGDRDQVTPLAESERMVTLLPRGRLDVVPGCGHALPWEAADRVADVIAGHALPARSSPDGGAR